MVKQEIIPPDIFRKLHLICKQIDRATHAEARGWVKWLIEQFCRRPALERTLQRILRENMPIISYSPYGENEVSPTLSDPPNSTNSTTKLTDTHDSSSSSFQLVADMQRNGCDDNLFGSERTSESDPDSKSDFKIESESGSGFTNTLHDRVWRDLTIVSANPNGHRCWISH